MAFGEKRNVDVSGRNLFARALNESCKTKRKRKFIAQNAKGMGDDEYK
jgi:hypothetical protein